MARGAGRASESDVSSQWQDILAAGRNVVDGNDAGWIDYNEQTGVHGWESPEMMQDGSLPKA